MHKINRLLMGKDIIVNGNFKNNSENFIQNVSLRE